MRNLTKILIAAVCLVALTGIAAACDECYTGKECKSPGYWKNHPCDWPSFDKGLTIGDIRYSKECAIAEMQKPVKGDKTYTMFDALVAAELNVKSGCPSCKIESTIEEADRWMEEHPLGSDVKASSDAWQKGIISCGYTSPSGEALYEKLDAYNNGYYC